MKKKEENVAAKKAKKTIKKAPKKSAPKKVAKKAAPAKKAAKKAVKKAPVKKTSAKKAAPKKAAPKKVKVVAKAPVKASAKSATTKASVNLQNFVTPLDDRLLVRLAGAEKMTAGGLYIPDTVSDVSGNLQGQVVAVGRGHRSDKGHVRPMDVKIGDKVVFPEYAGSKIKIQNEDLVILREAEVMGVVSK